MIFLEKRKNANQKSPVAPTGDSTVFDKHDKLWYNGTASKPLSFVRKGVHGMIFLDFLISVGASVVAYYVCKWLDRDE